MESHLRNLARERINEGLLPGHLGSELLGGASAGSVCALCAQNISPGSAEIETTVVTPEGSVTLLMHPGCSAAWSAVVREAAPGVSSLRATAAGSADRSARPPDKAAGY